MQAVKGNVLTRDDTFFGVCEAIGEDLGFHANWLRVGFALLLFFSPLAALAGYAGLAVLVVLTRLVAPNPRSAKASAGEPALETPAGAPADRADNDAEPALAAA